MLLAWVEWSYCTRFGQVTLEVNPLGLARSRQEAEEKVEQPPVLPKSAEKKETLLTRKAFISGFTGFLHRCRPDLMGPLESDAPRPGPKSLSEFVDAAADAAAASRPPLPAPLEPPSGSLAGPPVTQPKATPGISAGAVLGPSTETKKAGSFMEMPLEKPPFATPAPPKLGQIGGPPTTAPPGPPKTAMLPAGAIPPKDTQMNTGEHLGSPEGIFAIFRMIYHYDALWVMGDLST